MGGATPGMVNYGGLSSQQTPQGYGSMSSPQGYNAWMQNFLQSLYSPQQQQWQNANALMGGYGQGAGDLVGSYNPYAAIPAGATRQAPAPNVAPAPAPEPVDDPSTMVDPNAVAMLSASESGAGNKRGGRVGRAPGGMAGDPEKAIRRATMVAKSIARDVGPIPSQPAAPAVHPASMVPGVHVASEPQHFAEGGDVQPTDETVFDAWHGTPHEFPAERLIQHPTGEQEHIPASQPVPEGASVIKEFPLGRFRSDKIGTGEGAQAYGRGLYLGEEPTALGYKNTLRHRAVDDDYMYGVRSFLASLNQPQQQSYDDALLAALTSNNQTALPKEPMGPDALPNRHAAARIFSAYDTDEHPIKIAQQIQAQFPHLRDEGNFLQNGPKRLAIANQIEKMREKTKGHIYHVRVNANPEHFLDWDKPLSEQSEHVQKALEALHGEKMGYNSQILHPSNKGDNLYYTLASRFGRTREAHAQPTAAALHAAGIPGIRYLDANSRGPTGNPTHNHVIFDPSIIDIKRRYKRGGAVERHGYRTDGAVQEPSVSSNLENYQDPPSSRLAGWNWTPLAEVHKSLGSFSEIPSHIQNFGHFMNETAKKAATTGLTPRDLIKAYAITRSSIQREGRTPQKIMEHWPDFPGPKTGVIRPEGAMGEWLQTPMGQRYLDAAVKGNVDHDAVKDAIQSMKAFGLSSSSKQPTGEQQYLPYAAQMLPGQEKHVSDMVARAIHSDSAPQEWRDWAMKLSGIKYAKAGFLSSLLGRGDQPTADAREYNVHSGMTPGKERNKLIAKGQVDPVLRLAARHSALNIKMPSELQPHYQHLVHHAVWEHGGEPVTHEDIINAMRHAASGGEIDSPSIHNHILVHAMRAAGLPELENYAHGGTVDQALALTRRYARG
jgi:hypothetical protein